MILTDVFNALVNAFERLWSLLSVAHEDDPLHHVRLIVRDAIGGRRIGALLDRLLLIEQLLKPRSLGLGHATVAADDAEARRVADHDVGDVAHADGNAGRRAVRSLDFGDDDAA